MPLLLFHLYFSVFRPRLNGSLTFLNLGNTQPSCFWWYRKANTSGSIHPMVIYCFNDFIGNVADTMQRANATLATWPGDTDSVFVLNAVWDVECKKLMWNFSIICVSFFLFTVLPQPFQYCMHVFWKSEPWSFVYWCHKREVLPCQTFACICWYKALWACLNTNLFFSDAALSERWHTYWYPMQ